MRFLFFGVDPLGRRRYIALQCALFIHHDKYKCFLVFANLMAKQVPKSPQCYIFLKPKTRSKPISHYDVYFLGTKIPPPTSNASSKTVASCTIRGARHDASVRGWFFGLALHFIAHACFGISFLQWIVCMSTLVCSLDVRIRQFETENPMENVYLNFCVFKCIKVRFN